MVLGKQLTAVSGRPAPTLFFLLDLSAFCALCPSDSVVIMYLYLFWRMRTSQYPPSPPSPPSPVG